MAANRRLGVLLSGRGSNLQAIIDAIAERRLDAAIAVAISNQKNAGGLERARRVGIETLTLSHRGWPARDDYDRALVSELRKRNVGLVCLAGFMRKVGAPLIDAFPNSVLNIHPSLLPYHPGANAYKQAFEEGCRVSGCTAHFVTEHLDQGPVVLQDVFHIRVGEDTLDAVRTRGQELEGKVLSQAVQLFAADQLVVKDKKVIFRPGHITAS